MKKKGLRLFDVIAFTFSAVFVLDSFTAAAAIGWQSIIYWIVLAIIYFIPYGLITAELGSAYSDDGGIYDWVKKAFGAKWATRTNWFYWLNVGLWMSSVYIAFSSSISLIFFNNTLNIWIQIVIAITITWITVGCGLISLRYTKWLPDISSISKVVVTLALVIAAITWLATGHPVGTAINDPNVGIVPSWSNGIVFLPIIIYNLSGFELGSNAVKDMKNPKRDIPLSIIISGVTIILCYLIGTIAVNLIVDVNGIDLSNGIMLVIEKVFPRWLSIIIAIFLLITFFGTMCTWSTGANLAIKEAAADGEFPKIFASELKSKAPLWATIITGIISTVLLLVAGLTADPHSSQAGDIFWQLYSFSSVIFLLPYLLIFPSFIKLRKLDPNIKRPFKIAGPMWWQWILMIVPMIVLCLSIILFLFGKIIVGQETFEWNSGGKHLAFSFIGTFICIVIGEIIINFTEHKKIKQQY